MAFTQIQAPIDTFQGKKGTQKNIAKLARRLESLGITGILVGGCTDSSKKFPRKDIDVVVSSSVEPHQMEGYDAWYHYGDRTENATGTILYNSLGSFALGLGNLRPGLHVLPDLMPYARRDLSVTSYASLAEIVKAERDILLQHIGKPLTFSFQDRQYIGRLIASDMWVAELDDLVELNPDREHADRNEKDRRALELLEKLFSQEVNHFADAARNRMYGYFREEFNIRPSSITVNNIGLENLERQYELESRWQETNIPQELLRKYTPETLEGLILKEVGTKLTDDEVNAPVKQGVDGIVKCLFYYTNSGEFIDTALFSVTNVQKADSFKNRDNAENILTYVERKIEIDGIPLDIRITLEIPPDIQQKARELRGSLIDTSYLFWNSPEIFRQYNELARRNLLPFFDGYAGNQKIARQAIINFSDSAPPLIST